MERSDSLDIPVVTLDKPEKPPLQELLPRTSEKTSETVQTFSVLAELQRIARERVNVNEHLIPIPRIRLRDLTPEELDAIAARADILWLNGLFKRNAAQEEDVKNRWVKYQDVFPGLTEREIKERIGASSFAAEVQVKEDGTFQYIPDERIGTWEDIANFANEIRQRGKKVWMDLVGHVAYGVEGNESEVIKQHPEYFVHTTIQPDESNMHMFHKKPIEKDGIKYWIAYGTWTNGDYGESPEETSRWGDIAVLNLANKDVRNMLLQYAMKVGEIADGMRVDTSALFLENVFEKNWKKYLSDEEKRILDWVNNNRDEQILNKIFLQAQREARNRGREFGATGEVYNDYGEGNISRISQILHSIYDETRRWVIKEAIEESKGKTISWLVSDLQTLLKDGFFDDKTVYSATHDNNPLFEEMVTDLTRQNKYSEEDARKYARSGVMVVEWLTTLLPAKYHLLAPMPVTYDGKKVEVFASAFPEGNWWDRSKEQEMLSFIQSSEIWQSSSPMEISLHNGIITLQKIDPSTKKGVIIYINPQPWESHEGSFALPPGAKDLQVFTQQGEVIPDASDGLDGTINVILHGIPEKAAQIAIFNLS